MSLLRDRILRETEEDLNKGVNRLKELRAEVEELEKEIEDTRRIFHFLKTNKTELPPEFQSHSQNGKRPTPKQTKPHSDREVLATLSTLRAPFTSDQAAEAVGYTKTYMATKLRTLEAKKLVELASQGGFMPGEGAQGHLWKLV